MTGAGGSRVVAPRTPPGRPPLVVSGSSQRMMHGATLAADAPLQTAARARRSPCARSGESALAELGPWEPAQRYWRRNEPEYDVVARSVDGRRLLVGEAKSTSQPLPAAALRFRPGAPPVPDAAGLEIVPVVFAPRGAEGASAGSGVHVVDARTVFGVLR